MPDVVSDAYAVTAFLGRAGDAATFGVAEQVVPVIRTLAKAYTRGRGFTGNTPDADVAAVIISASARMVTNPGQLPVDEQAGPFTRSLRGTFAGWTLAEKIVLDRHRVTAM